MSKPIVSAVLGFGAWLLKTAALWLVLVVVGGIAYKLVPVSLPPPPVHDGPFDTQQAVLVVNGLTALAVSLLAARARVKGLPMFGLLFGAQFLIGTAVMQLDALYFNAYVALPLSNGTLGRLAIQAAITAFAVAAVGALIFRPASEQHTPLPANLLGRVALAGLAYVVLYYTAGALIAWQSEAVRAHYGEGAHFQPLQMLLFEYVRGILWSLAALFVVVRLRGALASRSLVMAVLFVVLTDASMLYPNAAMGWDVRQTHLIEVGTSEFVYGIIVTFILLAGAARRPLAADSGWRLVTGKA